MTRPSIRPPRSRLLFLAALLAPIAASGCVRSRTDASESIYTIDPRVLIFLSLAAWGSAFYGYLSRRTKRDLSLALMIGGGLILVTTIPALVASWVRVSDDRVEWRRGLVSRVYRFADMREIDLRPIGMPTEPGGDPETALIFQLKTNEIVVIRGDLSNSLMRAAAPEIVKRAERFGVGRIPRNRSSESPFIID